MKSVQEVTKYLKRQEKDAKNNIKHSRYKEDKAYFEGQEAAYRDSIIQLILLEDIVQENLKYKAEKSKKLFMLGFILGIFLGGTLLTVLTYLVISVV